MKANHPIVPSKARSKSGPSDTVVQMMGQSAVVATVLALGAGLGEGSWPILGVAVGLAIVEIWAVFRGPAGWSAFALQAIVQLTLVGTFFYAVSTHSQYDPYFSFKWSPDRTITAANSEAFNGHAEKAIALLNHALRYAPTDSRIYVARSYAYATRGQTQRAIQDLDEAIRLNPKNEAAYVDRANTYLRLGQTQRAIEDFDQAIRLNPMDGAPYVERANAYLKLGQTQRAVQDFDQAIFLDSKNARAYVYRGEAYLKLGQAREAISDFNQAISLSPTNYFYYEDRGTAYQALGNAKLAQRDFDKAKELRAQEKRKAAK